MIKYINYLAFGWGNRDPVGCLPTDLRHTNSIGSRCSRVELACECAVWLGRRNSSCLLYKSAGGGALPIWLDEACHIEASWRTRHPIYDQSEVRSHKYYLAAQSGALKREGVAGALVGAELHPMDGLAKAARRPRRDSSMPGMAWSQLPTYLQ
jgi:hypothetical protein